MFPNPHYKAIPMHCDSCQIVAINGIACHEIGCPDSWKDTTRECFECGCDFSPEGRYDQTCPDCLNPQSFDEFDELGEEEDDFDE